MQSYADKDTMNYTDRTAAISWYAFLLLLLLCIAFLDMTMYVDQSCRSSYDLVYTFICHIRGAA